MYCCCCCCCCEDDDDDDDVGGSVSELDMLRLFGIGEAGMPDRGVPGLAIPTTRLCPDESYR